GCPRGRLRDVGHRPRRSSPGDWTGRSVRPPLAAAALVPLLGLIACAQETVPTADRADLVRTARAETGTITDWIRLYGRIVPPPDRDATLAPLVAGALLVVPVREGQTV